MHLYPFIFGAIRYTTPPRSRLEGFVGRHHRQDRQQQSSIACLPMYRSAFLAAFLAAASRRAAAHPLCYVGAKPTDADQVLTFCPEPQAGACCTEFEEAVVEARFDAAGPLTDDCADLYKQVFCVLGFARGGQLAANEVSPCSLHSLSSSCASSHCITAKKTAVGMELCGGVGRARIPRSCTGCACLQASRPTAAAIEIDFFRRSVLASSTNGRQFAVI